VPPTLYVPYGEWLAYREAGFVMRHFLITRKQDFLMHE